MIQEPAGRETQVSIEGPRIPMPARPAVGGKVFSFLPRELVERINDFRWAHRFDSRMGTAMRVILTLRSAS